MKKLPLIIPSLFLLVSLVCATNAQAVYLYDIEEMTGQTMQSAVTCFDKITQRRYAEAPVMVRFTETHRNTRMQNLVRRFIYKSQSRKGSYAVPEKVFAERVPKRDLHLLRKEIFANADVSKRNQKKFTKHLYNITQQKSLDIYSINHGNNFVECSGIVVVDNYFNEMALFQSCYEE